MVVDDEPDVTTVIKSGLESQGYVVDAFNSAEDALTNFKPGVYDMLITDIRMPVMNGFDLYHEIRKNDDKIKIALMTAFEIYENKFRKMFKNVDVKCFLKKPVSSSNLTRRNEETCQSGD
jgi:CheY-like chemotaxis protein